MRPAADINTRGGVFGDGRMGGGIFGGQLSGLGQDEPRYSPTFEPSFIPTVEPETPHVLPTAPGLKSPDPRLRELQGYLNRVLSSGGYKPIDVDGKIGKGSCGAIAWYKSTGRGIATGTTKEQIDFNLANVGGLYATACTAKQPWSMPTKIGAAAPSRPSTPTGPVGPVGPAPGPLPYTPPPRFSKAAIGAVAVGGIAAVGLVWYGLRKGWF